MNETQTDRSKLGLALLVVAGQVGAVVAGGWSVQAVAKAQATAKAAVQ
jgi:hypothetical protein